MVVDVAVAAVVVVVVVSGVVVVSHYFPVFRFEQKKSVRDCAYCAAWLLCCGEE